MTTITLIYRNSGTDYSQDFDVLSIRGLADVDEVKFVAVQHRYLNGSIEEQMRGFQRVPTIDFGVVTDFSKRLFLYNFVMNPMRQIQYNGDVFYAGLGG